MNTMETKVNQKLNQFVNELEAMGDIEANIDSYLLRKIATMSVVIEEQIETIKQLTQTLDKIVENA